MDRSKLQTFPIPEINYCDKLYAADLCVFFFWCNGHLGECEFGEFRLSLLPSPVCAFQSTNRPRGRNGVYFQGSAPMR